MDIEGIANAGKMREIDENYVCAEAMEESGRIGYEFYRSRHVFSRMGHHWMEQIECLRMVLALLWGVPTRASLLDQDHARNAYFLTVLSSLSSLYPQH